MRIYQPSEITSLWKPKKIIHSIEIGTIDDDFAKGLNTFRIMFSKRMGIAGKIKNKYINTFKVIC